MTSIPLKHSIKEISPDDCIQTMGSRPVKVMCNDLDYYVCKYHCSQGFPFPLFNELLAGVFLQIWRLPVPDFALVQINTDHLKETEIPFHCFEKTCFGSKFMGSYKEADKFFIKMRSISAANQPGRDTFLKIAMFDIWLCNEDRHWENLNLLFDPKSQQFAPIDHVQCFNGANLGKEPALISHNESLLTSPILSRFFNRSLQRNANEIRLTLLDEFRKYVHQCHENIDNILATIPLDWNPNLSGLRAELAYYFSPEWTGKCAAHFTELYHQQINTY